MPYIFSYDRKNTTAQPIAVAKVIIISSASSMRLCRGFICLIAISNRMKGGSTTTIEVGCAHPSEGCPGREETCRGKGERGEGGKANMMAGFRGLGTIFPSGAPAF